MSKSWTKEQQQTYQKEYFPQHYQNNKQYYLDKAKKYRQETKKWYDEYKLTLSCTKCGESHPSCLQFHHKEPYAKEKEISRSWNNGWSRERILKEIAKCVVLCANCHAKLHWDARQVNSPKSE